MTTNNAPQIIIRPSEAVSFCKPKRQERDQLLVDVERFLANGGKVESLKGPAIKPYLNSTRKPLHAFCDSTPPQSLRNINKSKDAEFKRDYIAVWKVAHVLGVKYSKQMSDFRNKVGSVYPNPDVIKDGGKGTERWFWHKDTVKEVFGLNILDLSRAVK